MMNRNWMRAAACAGLCAAGGASEGGEVEQAWLQRHNGSASLDDAGQAITTDDAGNVYVAGGTGVDVGGGSFTARALLLKYSPDGALLWNREYAAPGFGDPAASGTHVAVAPGGEIIMAGATNSSSDWFVAAYDADGTPLWAEEYASDSVWLTAPHDLAIDGAGNIYLTGDIGMFGAAAGTTAAALVLKFSPDGDLVWDNAYVGPDLIGAYGEALAIDGEGSVYVAGAVVRSGLATEFAVIKLDSSGDAQWAMSDGGTSGSSQQDSALDVALDSAGNIVAAGFYNGNTASGLDTVVHKYAPDGTRQWETVFDAAPTGSDSARRMVIDSADGVAVIGNVEVGFNDVDILVARFDADGVLTWSDVTGGDLEINDFARAIAVDANDDLYGLAEFDDLEASKYATFKYDSRGQLLWRVLYDGPLGGATAPRDLTLGPQGGVLVTGAAHGGSTTEDDVVTIRYVEVPPSPDIDGDGVVGFSDLLWVLSTWGPCPSPPAECPADVDGDGSVGFPDLLIVLAAWG